jgi:acetyl-CoA carboxylase biotin carboxyl carrier protein
MNIKEVKDLIHEILQSDITEFELEHTGTKLRLRRGSGSTDASPSAASNEAVQPEATSALPVPNEVPASALPRLEEKDEDEGLHIITSPIVGTFYRAASPGSEAYVKVGDVVEEGQILCVVEAMKLMTEIPSDVTGEVARIYVENSDAVEFGQKLFGIRPRK